METHNYEIRYIARLWQKVDVKGPNDCWIWDGALSDGYGYAYMGGMNESGNFKAERVSRIVYRLVNGELGPGQKVLHTCDNPPCCNPAHLWAGTQLDNIRDMLAKGRGRWQKKEEVAA